MTTGLVFGKFAPLTQGHIAFIRKAAQQVDKLFLFLSYDQKFVDQQAPWIKAKLGLIPRFRDLWDVTKNTRGFHNVVVSFVDESDIPDYPEGGAAYAKLIRAKLPKDVELTHAFSSEPEYESYFNEFFPEAKHVVIDADRKEVPCSATKVRDKLHENFKYLSAPARKRFVRKVAIIGVESTGKTTLAQNLARYYGTMWTPEIGRLICENEFHSQELLMEREDYLTVARAHRTAEEEMITWAQESVVFSDTTNLITHFSAYCANKVSPMDPAFAALSKEEGDNFYDLVLYLQPDVPWVKDPLRLQDTPEKRQSTNEKLDMMVRHFYNQANVVRISGENYEHRFYDAIAAVDKLLYDGYLEVQDE